jgi:thiol-disulfide isomerase/thioredoxin
VVPNFRSENGFWLRKRNSAPQRRGNFFLDKSCNGPIFEHRTDRMNFILRFVHLPVFLGCILMLCIPDVVRSQTYITCRVSGFPTSVSSRLILEYYDGEGWSIIENTAEITPGEFSFSKPIKASGEYRLRLSIDPRKWVDFLYMPSLPDKEVRHDLALSNEDFAEKPIAFFKTREDSAYVELMTSYFLKFAESAPRLESDYDKVRSELAFRRQAAAVRLKYPTTYAARYVYPVIARQIPQRWDVNQGVSLDSLNEWDIETALLGVPFHDTLVLKNVAFTRNLNQLYSIYHTSSRLTQFVDELMPRAMANEKVQALVFKYLLDKLLDAKDEEPLHHLLTEYAEGCAANEALPQSTKNLLLALENCAPGKKIKPLTLPDIEGHRISMQEVFTKNKITLVLFWRSNCQHCKEFEPILEEVYSRYHPQGVEVYAIGTDKEEEAWRKQVASHSSPWPTVFLSYDSRKDFNKTYPVPSTPTLLAVDQNGVIVRRVILRSQLEKALEEMLKEAR